MRPSRQANRPCHWAVSFALVAALTGCTVGPDYVRPEAEVPVAFKEARNWKRAQPQDHRPRGNWWEIFNDPLLNTLEEQVAISNQNVLAAEAQFRQARALVQAARSGYFPTVAGSAAVSRSESAASAARTSSSASQNSSVSTFYDLALDSSWEIDVWGRVRRSVESSTAGAQASAADLESVRLSAQAQLAQSYFQLRIADAQQRLLDATVQEYQKSLQLTQNQYAAGVVARANVVQAQTQLESTRAQAIDVGVQRAQLEHAIAVLVGKPPAEFAIEPAPLAAVLPVIPAAVPAALLERRPDIAAAERRVAAANAEIGVAQAAYYPSLTLSASGGFQSSRFADWLGVPSRFWSLGPALAATLFDAGLRKSQTEQAVAVYDQEVAAYRQTVLGAFQEVEDNLVALRLLEREAKVQDDAVQAARESVRIARNQYKAGTVSYLNVVVVQAAALGNEHTAVDILGRRLLASVLLVKALGGGWKGPALPGEPGSPNPDS